MNVNDKRGRKEKVPFEVLDVGQAYEDKDGVLCIKTINSDPRAHFNCICFFGGNWESNVEASDSEVTPLVTTLEIES